MRAFVILWAIALLTGTTAASAQGFQNLDQLESLVVTTVGAEIGQPGGPVAPIDRRLRLAACPGIPVIEGPVFGAAIVRCDKIGWRIRVPLKLERPAAPGYARPAVAAAPVARTILIKKGDPVQLVAGDATFSVSRQMVADEDGAVGDMIRVRQDHNSPAVSGRVEADGIIRVPGI